MCEIFNLNCIGCGSSWDMISLHEVGVGPVEGDSSICIWCGTVHVYDARLRRIAPDSGAWCRWKQTAPHIHSTLLYLAERARIEAELRDVIGRWVPGSGLLDKPE